MFNEYSFIVESLKILLFRNSRNIQQQGNQSGGRNHDTVNVFNYKIHCVYQIV